MRGAVDAAPQQRKPVKEADVREQSTKLCECGCGSPVRKRFISGHNSQIRVLSASDYIESDMGFTTPCWIWQAQKSLGYGKVIIRKKRVWAHRAMWEQTNGPIPKGLELDHLCRTPACIRPEHLEAVTHLENVRRGRAVRVTPEVVAQIHSLRATGLSHREIAKHVPVGKSTVGDIVNGQRWA